jgi:hypothetical protein
MIDEPLVGQAAAWGVPLITAPAVLLLIACTNVALLLLSRSMARQHEISVRISLGASRSRLLQMLLVESALLTPIAVPLSLAVASYAPWGFRALIPQLPYYHFAIDAHVVAYLGAITLFAGIVAGIAPTLESLKKDVNAAFRGHEAVPGASGWRPRDVLVAAQVGMSLVLLVSAGLFLHAETRLLSANPGFDVDHVMLATPRISIPPHTVDTAASFYKTFVQRARGVPGVRAVAYARGAADEIAGPTTTTTVLAVDTGVTATATRSVVSSEYFRTMQTPVLGGTAFSDDAVSKPSVVISESLARALWPARMPIGETARVGDANVSIAGVARDAPSIVSGVGEPTVYWPAAAIRAGDVVYVGFGGAESQTARAIRDAIAAARSQRGGPAPDARRDAPRSGKEVHAYCRDGRRTGPRRSPAGCCRYIRCRVIRGETADARDGHQDRAWCDPRRHRADGDRFERRANRHRYWWRAGTRGHGRTHTGQDLRQDPGSHAGMGSDRLFRRDPVAIRSGNRSDARTGRTRRRRGSSSRIASGVTRDGPVAASSRRAHFGGDGKQCSLRHASAKTEAIASASNRATIPDAPRHSACGADNRGQTS